MARRSSGIRGEYERHGVQDYYAQRGADYRNPHEAAVQAALAESVARWRLDLTSVLDLACGSGETTLALRGLGCQQVEGVDPYTGEAYRQRTGLFAAPFSFEQIAAGALEGRRYHLIVCSYALHLLPESRLPLLCYHLSRLAPALLILTPHKRPHLRPEWGWTLDDEIIVQRVHCRLYTRQPH